MLGKRIGLAVPRAPGKLSLVQIGETDVALLHQPPLTCIRWELSRVDGARNVREQQFGRCYAVGTERCSELKP